MKKTILSLFLVCLSTAASPKQLPAPFTGTVDRIFDGDTIAVYGIDKNDRYKIYLENIDAPETRQKGGREAKLFLQKVAALKKVKIYPSGYNKKNELVAVVIMPDGNNLSVLSIQNGHSWWNRRYPDNARIEQAENSARQNKKGIWASKNPMPPWEWRKKQPFGVARKMIERGEFFKGKTFPVFKDN